MRVDHLLISNRCEHEGEGLVDEVPLQVLLVDERVERLLLIHHVLLVEHDLGERVRTVSVQRERRSARRARLLIHEYQLHRPVHEFVLRAHRVEVGRVQEAPAEKTRHRARLVDYVALFSQEIAQVLHLLRDFLHRCTPLARVQKGPFLCRIAQGYCIVQETKVLPHVTKGEIAHFDIKGRNMVFDSRTIQSRFMVFGAGERACEDKASRAFVFVFGFIANLTGILRDLLDFLLFIIRRQLIRDS